jgi:LacI family transcriptional regulator
MASAILDEVACSVASNDREAVRAATVFLLEQGHRRIGLVGGPHGFLSARERRLGFEDALTAAGIALPRSMVAAGNYTFESGLVAAERLLDLSPRPTAIFSCNDEMAAGVVHAARQRGLDVPRDLSIIGFDDTPIAAHIWPPLTTVRWPIASMARSATLKLIAGADGEDEVVEEPSMFLSTLIRRASVAAPATG